MKQIYSKKQQKKLMLLLAKVLQFIRSDNVKEADLFYSSYSNKDALIIELKSFIEAIENNDFKCIDKLEVLFAPTSDLQEIAISSDWHDEYMRLATAFDNIKDNVGFFSRARRYFSKKVKKII